MTTTASSTADYIIVGAGSAGCLLANRLSADPANSVMLLEAGGDDKHPLVAMPLGFVKMLRNPRFIWNYKSEPEPNLNHRAVIMPRGKMLSGSSSINGMLYFRGHPGNYEEWSRMGCTGWSFAEATAGFARGDVTIDRQGRRASSSRAYLWPAMSRPNRVQPNVQLKRTLQKASKRR